MSRSLVFLVAAAIALVIDLPAFARERSRAPAAAAEAVGLFEAESDGLVGISFIPNDSRSAQVVVRNKSKKPLTLRLPAAFAGVPVVAQMGMGGMGGGGMGGGGMGGMGGGGMGGGMTQAMGGGMGGGGMGGGGMGGMGGGGMGGGMFSVPPETVRTLRVATVCLEHGKPEPSSRHPYKLVSLESYSEDPQLALILESFGRGEMTQKVAQAAAWHVTSGLSWERLAAEMIDRAGGFPDEPYFKPAELRAAHRLVGLTSRNGEALRPEAGSLSGSDQ